MTLQEKEAGLEKLYNQATGLIVDMQMIADSLAEYNPGLCKNKVPLDIIQYDVASLARELADLHGEIGGRIRDDDL